MFCLAVLFNDSDREMPRSLSDLTKKSKEVDYYQKQEECLQPTKRTKTRSEYIEQFRHSSTDCFNDNNSLDSTSVDGNLFTSKYSSIELWTIYITILAGIFLLNGTGCPSSAVTTRYVWLILQCSLTLARDKDNTPRAYISIQ